MVVKDSYIVIDIGTGNVRVAVTGTNGHVLSVATGIMHYEKDKRYNDALYFDPIRLWDQIVSLTTSVLKDTPDTNVKAVTATSQREGIVLIDNKGNSLIGLPNIDHRGREWENDINDKDLVYQLTGRYPTSLFSALKLIGIKKKRPEIYSELYQVMSISDWAQFKLSGVSGYEHSQASETLLYDIEKKNWSQKLCSIFKIDMSVLSKIHLSGTILGKILPSLAKTFKISPLTVIVVGGADTQLAIMSTMPAIEDVIIVAGTTTPIVKIVNEYIVDQKQRTWTNRHTEVDKYILEANAGVTGLNYQRLREIFYPHESYEVIEEELSKTTPTQCVASLGSLIAEEDAPLTRGGFIFEVPVSHELTRACFVWAILWDIACCIKENFECLGDVSGYDRDYIWACGGGVKSTILRQFIANLINKKVQVRKGYRQSSVVGGAFICNQALNDKKFEMDKIEVIYPKDQELSHSLYLEWKAVRAGLKGTF